MRLDASVLGGGNLNRDARIKSRKSSVKLFHARLMQRLKQPVHRGAVPAKPSGQTGSGLVAFLKAPIERDFQREVGRNRVSHYITANGSRNLLKRLKSTGDSFFDRIHSASRSILSAISVCGDFGKLRTSHKKTITIRGDNNRVLQSHSPFLRVTPASVDAEVFFDFVH